MLRALADAVMVVHLTFIVFVALGALLAWHWPRLMWLHVPAVVWGTGIVAVGYECPLTALEKWLLRLGSEGGYRGGFIDRYIEDVIYPEELTPLMQALVATGVAVGYVGLVQRRRRAISEDRHAGHAAGSSRLTSCTTQLLPSGSLKDRNEP